MTSADPLRFPIGPFEPRGPLDLQDRSILIEDMAGLPSRLSSMVADLSEAQLNTPYRPGGWTVRQVVHHLADSHLQGYVRFKLAMTERDPTVKTYDQVEWGKTADSLTGPVGPSLELLQGLHRRWVFFLQTLEPNDFARAYIHPEMGKVTLEMTLQLYAWHGNHHLAHVKSVARTSPS